MKNGTNLEPKNTISESRLKKYSSKFDWVERAKAYDKHLQKKYLDSTIQNVSEITYLRGKLEKEEFNEFKDINKEMRSVIKVLLNNIHDSYDLLQEKEITQREFTQAIKHDVLCIEKLHKCTFKSSEYNHDAIYDRLNIDKENEVNDVVEEFTEPTFLENAGQIKEKVEREKYDYAE